MRRSFKFILIWIATPIFILALSLLAAADELTPAAMGDERDSLN